jgi:hypothetical protein
MLEVKCGICNTPNTISEEILEENRRMDGRSDHRMLCLSCGKDFPNEVHQILYLILRLTFAENSTLENWKVRMLSFGEIIIQAPLGQLNTDSVERQDTQTEIPNA